MIVFGLKYFLEMFSSLSLSFLSITIVNIALLVLKFLSLPQGDILTIVIERKESDNDENIPSKYFSKKKKSSRDLFGDCYLAVVLN